MLGYTREELLKRVSSEELTLWIEELKLRYDEERKANKQAKPKGRR